MFKTHALTACMKVVTAWIRFKAEAEGHISQNFLSFSSSFQYLWFYKLVSLILNSCELQCWSWAWCWKALPWSADWEVGPGCHPMQGGRHFSPAKHHRAPDELSESAQHWMHLVKIMPVSQLLTEPCIMGWFLGTNLVAEQVALWMAWPVWVTWRLVGGQRSSLALPAFSSGQSIIFLEDLKSKKICKICFKDIQMKYTIFLPTFGFECM